MGGQAVGAVRELRLAVTVDDFDAAVEVGERVAGPIRVALEVEDSAALAAQLAAAGADQLAEPVVTPWQHATSASKRRGLQLTLFTVLEQ